MSTPSAPWRLLQIWFVDAQALQDAMRPRLHVIGVLCHGFAKLGFLVDPTLAKDSNLFCEVVVQSLQLVFRECRERGVRIPSRLVIVADNAGDNKNTYTMTMTAATVASRMFRLSFSLYLRTGHSHEDLDAHFGLWAQCLCAQRTLEVPSDFVNALRGQFRDSEFRVLSYVRDWCDHFNTCCVKLTGMGGSVGAAHSYTWARRGDIGMRFGCPTSSFTEDPHPNDVLLLPRKYMSTPGLCQEPIVALPWARFQRLRDTETLRVVPRLQYSAPQARKLHDTADLVAAWPFNLANAARYLRALADGFQTFWAPLARTELVPIGRGAVAMPGLDGVQLLGVWHAPANLIEPPAHARNLVALPVRDKTVLAKKRRRGRGAMAANVVEGPPPLGPEHGIVIAVAGVLEDGDLDAGPGEA